MKAESIIQFFPKSQVTNYIPYWQQTVSEAELSTPERIAMFLAQVGHECQGFTRFFENLNYSAQGLANTWPSRYAVDRYSKIKVPNKLALSLHRKPEAIANNCYANRNGNGNEKSGDGWRYRGRDPIMTTFHDNYLEVDTHYHMNGKIMAIPDLLFEPAWGMKAASYYWISRGLNHFADKEDIVGSRKVINGGLIGLEDVQKLYNRIIATL